MRAVILDNLRSAHNVGSIIRTVSALEYSAVALCGVTITPPSDKLKKTSRGLHESCNWTYYKETEEAVKSFKENGYKVYALEVNDQSQTITKIQREEKLAFVVGNEALGVHDDVLALCDKVYNLPMLNQKEGINVSCAFSSAAYYEYLMFSN